MIDINEIKGKSIKYIGERSQYFTYGECYRIGFDYEVEDLFTIDDDGDYHNLTPDYIEQAFDVADYIKKSSMVGKYVRYISDGSDFIRKGDIGIIVKDHNCGVAYDVHWLNPIVPHTETLPTWFVMACHVGEIE